VSEEARRTATAYTKKFGSPAYVYDLAEARSSYATLRAAVPAAAEIAYSLKANPHPALVREFGKSGCWLEVSSAGELTTAAPACRPMIFTGPGKSDDDLTAAVRTGCVVSAESPAELTRIATVAGRLGVDIAHVRVILRLNPDAGVDLSGFSMGGETPFGLSAARSQDWRAALTGTGIRALGYHVYGGSNMADVDGLLRYFRAAAGCIAAVNQVVGLDIQMLDLGGGFPAPYAQPGSTIELAGLHNALEDLFTGEVFGGPRNRPRVVVESGRFLAARAGILVATVRDVKHTAAGTRFVVLDTGVNHLAGMSALRRIPPVAVAAVTQDLAALGEPSRLVGPLCTPLDVLNLRATLPDTLSIGDMVTVPNVGAYGLGA
jgi:diaminopimelate decarboxylase